MDRTTNYNLKKPSTGDPVLVGDLNDNMDVIDTQLNAITDGIAIIANGNTHAAIAKDQAVFVKNHSSLANGLYWATAAISANGALSTSNLTADTSGGLNKLHDDITTLNSNSRLKYKNMALGDITMNESGYYDNRNNKPTTPTDMVLLFVELVSVTANGKSGVPLIQGNGDYIYGESNTTYRSVVLRYIYARADEVT